MELWMVSISDYESGFLDSVYVISHSKKTVQTYRSSINHLRKFTQKKFKNTLFEIISQIRSEEIDVYDYLREFIIYLDKLGIKPKGIRAYLSGVKGFLRYSKIKINSDDFKHTVRVPKLVKTREIPLDKEMILRVLHNSSSKIQTAILVACSSGLRIGELVQLKVSDIDFDHKPTKITVRANTSKTRQSRETFITSEATKSLKDYLVRYFEYSEINDNSHLNDTYIFGRITKKGRKSKTSEFSVDSAKLTLQKGLRDHVSKIPELDKTNENGYKAIHFHGFRKYFRTIVGNVSGRDFSESLIGHSFYMDTYYNLTEESKVELYLRAEPHLTFSDFKEVEREITNLTVKCNELEDSLMNLKQYIQNKSIEPPTELVK